MSSSDLNNLPQPEVKKTILPVLLITLVALSVTGIGGYITKQTVDLKLNDFFNRQADQIANTYTTNSILRSRF